MLNNSKSEENISLEKIVKKLETISIEDIRKKEKITSKWKSEKEGFGEVFYTLSGYSVSVDDYEVFIGQSTKDDFNKNEQEKFLGFRIKVSQKGKIIKRTLDNSDKIKDIYETLDIRFKEHEEKNKKEDHIYFTSVLDSIVTKKQLKYWKEYEEEKVSIPKNLTATSYFYHSENYLTEINGQIIILQEKETQIGDVGMLGLPYPHPYSPPVMEYRMKIVKDGKIVKVFEGEDYTPSISLLINCLKGTTMPQEKEKKDGDKMLN